jgi:predicted permease
MLHDLRLSLRLMARHPGFAVTAVLLLALGIGAGLAIFSVANSLFLRPLPVADPERVVRVFARSPTRSFDVMSYPTFLDLRDRTQAFEGLVAHQQATVSVGLGGEGETAATELVSGDYFETLGLRPALGRLLGPDDDRVEGGHPVVVVSHRFWQVRLAGDSAIVGRVVHLNGHPFTVVGVAPESFYGSYAAFASDAWVPLMMYQQARPIGLPITTRGWGWLSVIGRLRGGADVDAAGADLDRVAGELRALYPDANRGLGFGVAAAGALPEDMREGTIRILTILLTVLALVLIATCANLGGSLLARVAGRRREIAVARAVGASPARVARQWVVEGLVIAGLGGALGLLAVRGSSAFVPLLQPSLEGLSNLRLDATPDWRVVFFAAAVTLMVGLLIGLVPAIRAAREDVVESLKASAGGSRRESRVYRAFVALQVGVALALLFAATLSLRSVRNAEAFDVGFDPEGLVVARVDLVRIGYDEARARTFYGAALERLRSLPGVRSAVLGNVVPLGFSRESISIGVEGHVPADGRPGVSVAFNIVGPGYFELMSIPIAAGRSFSGGDGTTGAPRVAIVNETFARTFWPGASALGRRLDLSGRRGVAEVVGVVRDIKYYTLAEAPLPYLYLPDGPSAAARLTFHVRAAGDPSTLVPAIRRALREIDPRAPVVEAMTFGELRRLPLLPGRILAGVTTAFGALVLVLCCAGLYSLVVLMVTRRTRELGIRLALGARSTDVLGLVVGEGMSIVGIGLVAGTAGAFLLARALRSYLFELTPWSPATLLAVAAVLAAAALVACYLPARRTGRIDPIVALRAE